MSSTEERKLGRPVDPAKRDAIIAAATDSFFEHGFAASTIEGIAARAGVSKVTVYNHFGDKRGLFAASVEQEAERMRAAIEIGIDDPRPLHEKLHDIGSAIMAFLSRPKMIQFELRIAAETRHDPEIGALFLANGPNRMKAGFIAMLAEAAQAEGWSIPDPAIAAEQFISMCKGMGDLERRFGAPPDPAKDAARIDGAVTVFLRAYRR